MDRLAFGSLKGIEHGVIAMLIGDGADHQVMDLFRSEGSLIGHGFRRRRSLLRGTRGPDSEAEPHERYRESEL